MKRKFRPFPSIKKFHNIVYAIKKSPDFYPENVIYKSKVKLHGTNACIGVYNGKAFAQKRSTIIEGGHFGFAEFVERISTMFKNCPDCYIYGEWVGSKIQKSVACSKIPEKKFCIFAVYMNGYYYVDPSGIIEFLQCNTSKCADSLKDIGIHIISWFNSEESILNIKDSLQCIKFIEEQTLYVEEVDKSDPWIKNEFGIDGIGEGLVYYPVGDSLSENEPRYDMGAGLGIHEDVFVALTFKAKGLSHTIVKSKKNKSIQLSPDVLKSIAEYVEKFVTEERLNQIVEQNLDGVLSENKIGIFMKEFCNDVIKESKDELEVGNLEWKIVQKRVQTKARDWYIEKIQNELYT